MNIQFASVYRIYTHISASADGVDSAVSACIYASVHGIDLLSVSLSDLQYYHIILVLV